MRQFFTVKVSALYPKDSSAVVCVNYDSDAIPPSLFTISCPDNTLGRYVYYSRLPGGFDAHHATLCEVIVIGHKQIGKYPNLYISFHKINCMLNIQTEAIFDRSKTENLEPVTIN